MTIEWTNNEDLLLSFLAKQIVNVSIFKKDTLESRDIDIFKYKYILLSICVSKETTTHNFNNNKKHATAGVQITS
jgi:hypothetical protein